MSLTLVPLFPGIPGGPELLIVLLIVVLLFGANKLPKLARSSGQAMGEFKRGREEIDQELRSMSEKDADADADDAESPPETEEESDRTSAA
jgi:sec-independent protein translocase protein TatA